MVLMDYQMSNNKNILFCGLNVGLIVFITIIVMLIENTDSMYERNNCMVVGHDWEIYENNNRLIRGILDVNYDGCSGSMRVNDKMEYNDHNLDHIINVMHELLVEEYPVNKTTSCFTTSECYGCVYQDKSDSTSTLFIILFVGIIIGLSTIVFL